MAKKRAKKQPENSVNWRDRVKEFRRVKASELRRNPANFTIHTPEQRSAFQGILREVGFAGAVLARQAEDGVLELIDGELRTDAFGDQEIPVLILDVDDDEAKLLLASYDEITRMAEVAGDRYRALLADLAPQDADLRRFIAMQMPDDSSFGSADGSQDDGPPEMELLPHEHYDYVLVLARTTHEWNRLVELLQLSTIRSPHSRKAKIGIGRGVEAAKLIGLLENAKLQDRGAEQASAAEHEEDPGAAA